MPERSPTLLGRLTVVLALLMLCVGVFTVVLILGVNRLYLAEMQQRINRDVAAHIVAENILLRDGVVDREALEHVFHMLMVVNPSIELYLLGTDGRILAFSAPEGAVRARSVELAPVRRLLEGAPLPILGDDPRHPGAQKPFSASEIRGKRGLEGYLYIVVGGEPFADAVSQLAGSYFTRLGIGVLILGQGLALVTGYVLVSWTVRRLGALRAAIRSFEASGFRRAPALPRSRRGAGDEIDELAASFEAMGRRITQLLEEIGRADEQRRELVASISHDLRTPLAAMRGYLETLALKGDRLTPEERRGYVEITERQGLRLQRLIDDLFELSKLEARHVELRREPFSIAELVQDVAQKLTLEASRRGIEIRAEISTDMPMVEADVGLIERVLTNLLENALKYTARGGTVAISTHASGPSVSVAVTDNGRGIPAEELPRVFERFYRGSAARSSDEEGTGLGLAIAARIVQLHQSELDATSRLGEGTTFRFRLPALPDAASPAA